MATNLLTGKEKNVVADKPQNLLPEFTQIQENSNEVSNVERGKNLFTVANETSNKYNMAIKTAMNYEDTKSKSDLIGGLTTFMLGLKRLPRELQSSVLKLHQGAEGASVVEKNWMQRFLVEADTDSQKFMADIFAKYGETKIVPKIPIKITDVAALPQNLAFSIVSMGSGAAAGIPIGLLPVPGARVAAWSLGTVASGKAAYEMATYEIMQTYLEVMNEQEITETGKGITLEKEKELKETFNFEAMKYGLWEAIPEALSNLAFAKLLTVPLGKMVGKGVTGKMINKIVGVYGEELITETITQKGQAGIELRAGLRTGEDISFVQAFKEVAPQTFLLTSVMAGAGSSSVAIKNRVQLSLQREMIEKKIKPEDVEAAQRGMEEHVDSIINEKDDIQSGIDQKTQESVTGTPIAEEGVPGVPEGAVEAVPGVEEIEVEVAPIKAELTKTTPITKESIRRALDITIEKEVRKLEKKEEKRLSVLDKAKLQLKSTEATIKTIREIPEFNVFGVNIFEGKQELVKDLIEDKKILQEKISKFQPEKIARTATDILKEKIRNIQRGIREGQVIAKQDIKAVQTDVINIIEASDLEAADKAKFIRTIKNIQTAEQLQKALPEIETRIARLVESEAKRTAKASIKKELKTTKPLKVGDRRVGKFDFQTNKTFDTLRDFNKLNQAKAQEEFDKFPEEGGSELDLIKKRFLSLKANGAAASRAIHEQVLADIKRIKQLGKEAKDQADLEKRINRQEIVDSALASIDKITGSKDTIIGKIVNIYRKGFSNIYSMLNSIGGQAFAEAYNPELSESRRDAATYESTLNVTMEASKIYNEKNIMKLFESMSLKDYEITDVKDGLTTKLSKLELIDIYNSLKNDKKRTDYYEAYGQEQVDTLMGSLTSKDTLFGDALQENVQGYREILNARSIETTGRDLGFVENYWPATSEFQVSVLDDVRVQGETPSALRERAKPRVTPVPRNAWYKAQKHIAQAEHVDNLSREFEKLKRLFSDRRVKHAVTEKYGEDVYNTILAQIDNVSLNKQTERIDLISSTFQKAINNWVTAKIALNPSTYVRQLMSMGNYVEHMDPLKWTTGFFKGIASPKETFNFMWNNAPFLKARFNRGYSEALKSAIEGAERISVNKSNYTKMLTALVRSGDITAIIYGGFPLVKHLTTPKSEGGQGLSMQEAIDIFEKATLKSQQSGLSSSISQFQNSRNPFARLFLAFKNTSNQYFRKMVDATISFQNGDISAAQYAKTMAIYAVVQPILYVAAGHATSAAFGFLGSLVGLRAPEDPEELLEKFLNAVMIQLIVSPVNAIPIIDDVARTAARKLTGQKIYKIFSTPLLDDLEKGFRSLTKNDVTGEDYLKAATSILIEPITALPVKTGIRLFETLTGKKISGKKSGKKLIR